MRESNNLPHIAVWGLLLHISNLKKTTLLWNQIILEELLIISS